MKHPIVLNIEKQFPDVKMSHKVPFSCTYRIPYAEAKCWKNDHFSIVQQEYDAKDAYFCLLEIYTNIPLTIYFNCICEDLYWFYQLIGDILFSQVPKDEQSFIMNHEYKIIYTPPDCCSVSLEPGHYLSFYFVLDRQWFMRQSHEYYTHFEDFRQAIIEETGGCKHSKMLPIHYGIKQQLIQLFKAKQQDGIVMEARVYDFIAQLFNISHDDLKGPPELNSYVLASVVRDIIINHVKEGNEFSISEIANSLSISRQHLSKVHKKHYRDTLLNFQKNTKLQEGMRLLREEGFTPTEVALHLNTHPSNFSKSFLKKFGISPKDVSCTLSTS